MSGIGFVKLIHKEKITPKIKKRTEIIFCGFLSFISRRRICKEARISPKKKAQILSA